MDKTNKSNKKEIVKDTAGKELSDDALSMVSGGDFIIQSVNKYGEVDWILTDISEKK